MLQRGDRAAAEGELEKLARNFSDQPELVNKARKLLPGGAAMLPAPGGEAETFQLILARCGPNHRAQAHGQTMLHEVIRATTASGANSRQSCSTRARGWTFAIICARARRSAGPAAGAAGKL